VRLLVAAQAAERRTGLGRQVGADCGDPAVPGVQQVPGRLAGGGHVVDGHPDQPAALHPLAEQDGRDVERLPCEVLPGQRHRAEDQAVDHLRAVALQDLSLPVPVGCGLVDEQRHPARVRRPLDVVRQLGEVRGGDLRERQADHPVRPGAGTGR
jgi:hypothetical protein